MKWANTRRSVDCLVDTDGTALTRATTAAKVAVKEAKYLMLKTTIEEKN